MPVSVHLPHLPLPRSQKCLLMLHLIVYMLDIKKKLQKEVNDVTDWIIAGFICPNVLRAMCFAGPVL